MQSENLKTHPTAPKCAKVSSPWLSKSTVCAFASWLASSTVLGPKGGSGKNLDPELNSFRELLAGDLARQKQSSAGDLGAGAGRRSDSGETR
jgi:hypothetical protein